MLSLLQTSNISECYPLSFSGQRVSKKHDVAQKRHLSDSEASDHAAKIPPKRKRLEKTPVGMQCLSNNVLFTIRLGCTDDVKTDFAPQSAVSNRTAKHNRNASNKTKGTILLWVKHVK